MTETARQYGSSAAQAAKRDITEPDVWADAYRIANPGAANPAAVAATLARDAAALVHHIGTDGVRKHPALRVIAGQLSYLFGVDRLGPSLEDLDKVMTEAKAMGIAYQD